MLLRFDVSQAECFRRGIDCPKSTVTIEVKPSELSQDDRNLIADRMNGIDVYRMSRRYITNPATVAMNRDPKPSRSNQRIMAITPDFKGLMDAVRENDAELKKEGEELAKKAE